MRAEHLVAVSMGYFFFLSCPCQSSPARLSRSIPAYASCAIHHGSDGAHKALVGLEHSPCFETYSPASDT